MQAAQHLAPVSDGLMRKAHQIRTLKTGLDQEIASKNVMREERNATRAALSIAEENGKALAVELEASKAETAKKVDEADAKGYSEGYAEAQEKFLKQMEGINAQLAELLEGAFRSGYSRALKAAEVPEGSALYGDIPPYGEPSAAAEPPSDAAAVVQSPAQETGLPEMEREPDSSVAEDGGPAA
jgi:hypothetical protein